MRPKGEMVEQQRLRERCPACGCESDLRITPYEVPYFGEILIFTAFCERCKYRSTDVLVLSERKKKRYEFKVRRCEDLNVRVVRSSFGRIEIPELGVSVEPRRGEAFISTVEGVLERVRRVVEMLAASEEEHAKKKRAKEILRKIEEIKDGKECMTLIIEDPTGNSAIINER